MMDMLIQSTVYLTITAVVLLIFKRLLKNKLSAKLHLWLWALLLIRIVVPFLPESPISVFNIIPTTVEHSYYDTPIDDYFKEDDEVVIDFEKLENADYEEWYEYFKGYHTDDQNYSRPNVILQLSIPELVWIIGAIGLLVYFIVVYGINVSKIKKRELILDAHNQHILKECKDIVGVKRRVYLFPGETPMLVKKSNYIIVLPVDYNDSEKKNIIIHELCHLKHNDIYLIAIGILVLCFNWFNPVMWYAFFMFRRDVEVYCDERVLKYTESKKEYATLLVKTALVKNKFVLGTTALQNGEKEVQRRVKHIAKFKKPKAIWFAVAGLIAVVVGIFCLTNTYNYNENEMSEERYNQYINQNIGATMAQIDYADNDKVVFHYIDGLFVFDISDKKIERSFDLSTLNCTTNQQGSNILSVKVSDDGKTALLVNAGVKDEIENYDNYIVNLRNGEVKVTDKTELENSFNLYQDNIFDYNTTEWCSDNCIVIDDNVYYIFNTDGKLSNIKLKIESDGNSTELYMFNGEYKNLEGYDEYTSGNMHYALAYSSKAREYYYKNKRRCGNYIITDYKDGICINRALLTFCVDYSNLPKTLEGKPVVELGDYIDDRGDYWPTRPYDVEPQWVYDIQQKMVDIIIY